MPTLETREAKDVAVKVDEAVLEKWKERLGKWRDKVGWVVVDGFLMYWDVVRSMPSPSSFPPVIPCHH